MFGLERLPDVLPVFPLAGALLLPKGHLPLNIFSPRYLDMIYHAREKDGLIGMVQPSVPPLVQQKAGDRSGSAPRGRPLYTTGCVGMISRLVEGKKEQRGILLTGLSRFDIVEELSGTQTFRQVRVSYDRFQEDCAAPLRSGDIPRQKLTLTAAKYLKLYNVLPQWTPLKKTCDEEFVNTLAMICPFSCAEKQALLEIISLKDRLELMLKLMAFEISGGKASPPDRILQ